MPSRHNQGLLPGEYMKVSMVKVYSEDPFKDAVQPTFDGRPVATPEEMAGMKPMRVDYYICIVRRSVDGQWHYELLKAQPYEAHNIPEEVFKRFSTLTERIKTEQRSDRGKEQYAARIIEVADSDELRDLEALAAD